MGNNSLLLPASDSIIRSRAFHGAEHAFECLINGDGIEVASYTLSAIDNNYNGKVLRKASVDEEEGEGILFDIPGASCSSLLLSSFAPEQRLGRTTRSSLPPKIRSVGRSVMTILTDWRHQWYDQSIVIPEFSVITLLRLIVRMRITFVMRSPNSYGALLIGLNDEDAASLNVDSCALFAPTHTEGAVELIDELEASSVLAQPIQRGANDPDLLMIAGLMKHDYDRPIEMGAYRDILARARKHRATGERLP